MVTSPSRSNQRWTSRESAPTRRRCRRASALPSVVGCRRRSPARRRGGWRCRSVSPTSRSCLSAVSLQQRDLAGRARASGPATFEAGLNGSAEAVATIVPPPPLDFFSLPSTTSAAGRPEVALGLGDAGDRRDSVDQRSRRAARRLAELAGERVLRRDLDVDAAVDAMLCRSLEPAADLVGQHVGAGDHRHAEQHRDRGERRSAACAGRAPRSASADHRASALRWSRISSCDGRSMPVDDPPVGQEQDRVGDRRGARRRG